MAAEHKTKNGPCVTAWVARTHTSLPCAHRSGISSGLPTSKDKSKAASAGLVVERPCSRPLPCSAPKMAVVVSSSHSVEVLRTFSIFYR